MKPPNRAWMPLLLASLYLTAPALFLYAAEAADDAKPANSPDHPSLADILTFETAQTNTSPAGWSGGPVGTIFVDDKVVHGGHWSARIERGAESIGLDERSTFSSVELSCEDHLPAAVACAWLWMTPGSFSINPDGIARRQTPA